MKQHHNHKIGTRVFAHDGQGGMQLMAYLAHFGAIWQNFLQSVLLAPTVTPKKNNKTIITISITEPTCFKCVLLRDR